MMGAMIYYGNDFLPFLRDGNFIKNGKMKGKEDLLERKKEFKHEYRKGQKGDYRPTQKSISYKMLRIPKG